MASLPGTGGLPAARLPHSPSVPTPWSYSFLGLQSLLFPFPAETLLPQSKGLEGEGKTWGGEGLDLDFPGRTHSSSLPSPPFLLLFLHVFLSQEKQHLDLWARQRPLFSWTVVSPTSSNALLLKYLVPPLWWLLHPYLSIL